MKVFLFSLLAFMQCFNIHSLLSLTSKQPQESNNTDDDRMYWASDLITIHYYGY